jgi:glycoprotein 6-alpha-L-fucosyltransferase
MVSNVNSYQCPPDPGIDLKETEERLQFVHPVVGVHVRRTDKVGTEAAFHSLQEYMGRVEEWFEQHEIKHPQQQGKKRNVYLATDEPLLLEEARIG